MERSHTRGWPQIIHPTTIWYCNLGHSELQRFKSPRELEEHIESVHPELFTAEELTSRLRRSVLLQPRSPGICPLCNTDIFPLPENSKEYSHISEEDDLVNSSEATADSSADTILKTISRHIAEHLKSLALLSIRYLEDEFQSTGCRNSESTAFDSHDTIFDHKSGIMDDSTVLQVPNEIAPMPIRD